MSERTKKQAGDLFCHLRTEQEDTLRVEREHRARLEREWGASAYEAGRQQALRHYRDAFVHYYPNQWPRMLDRHFLDAFPYARTTAPLSPLLPYDNPVLGVVEDDDEVVLGDKDIDLGGEDTNWRPEENEDPVTTEVGDNSDSGPAGGSPD